MLRVTRWSPDTCGCILDIEWDDSQDENQRVHTLKKVVKRCSVHEITDSVFDQVVSENRRKNLAWGIIKKELHLTDDELGRYAWSFDSNRNLQITVVGPIERGALDRIRSSCDQLLGNGTVRLDNA